MSCAGAEEAERKASPKRRVVIDLQAAWRFHIVLSYLFFPTAFGHALESLHQLGTHLHRFRKRLLSRVPPDIVADGFKPGRCDLGSDVHEAGSEQTFLCDACQHHGDQAAARRADEGDTVQPEMVQERGHVSCFDRHRIGLWAGPFRLAATSVVQPDKTYGAREVWREIVEVAAVSRETRKRENWQALAVVGIVEPCAVWCVEFGHRVDLASSGIGARSLITRAGRAGNLCIGLQRPSRLSPPCSGRKKRLDVQAAVRMRLAGLLQDPRRDGDWSEVRPLKRRRLSQCLEDGIKALRHVFVYVGKHGVQALAIREIAVACRHFAEDPV